MKMRRKFLTAALLLALLGTLSGCVRTVEELYRVPRRSMGYQHLEGEIDQQMEGLNFSAPRSGENQQAVQMEDLDGDGVEEVLLFARGSGDRPMTVLLFAVDDGVYHFAGKIERPGAAFYQVEYLNLDGKPGKELVVSTELNEQLPRNMAVFRMDAEGPEKMLSTECRQFLCCDLDENGSCELLVLGDSKENAACGIATLFGMTGDSLIPWGSAELSRSARDIKRIMPGGLSGGRQAVFVASAVDENTIVTDVFAVVNGWFTNVAKTSGIGTGVDTLRDCDVYSEDIDHDGEMELPSLISVKTPASMELRKHGEHLIRWYAMTEQGEQITKRYTFHNFQQHWYMTLRSDTATRVCVVEEDDGSFSFLLWNEEGTELTELWTVYVLTGDERSASAEREDCFVLLKTDTAVYEAVLSPAAGDYGILPDNLKGAFHLIYQGWKTGEM